MKFRGWVQDELGLTDGGIEGDQWVLRGPDMEEMRAHLGRVLSSRPMEEMRANLFQFASM